LRDGLVWQFAKNPANEEHLEATIEVFQAHGFELIEWDDSIEALGQ